MLADFDTLRSGWQSLLDAEASSVFLVSYLGLTLSFFLLRSRYYATVKQSSWIITTVASAIMSLASVPFLWDFLAGGEGVRGVTARRGFAVGVNRFFQAYLVVDLMMGAAFYRSQISLLAGWIHHPVYILIVELVVRRSWAHIFCLCAAMELPTFILGISTLHPRLRNNVLFAAAFFATRIVMHVVLGMSYYSLENRVGAAGGSVVPALLLAMVFPLHLMWFVGCMKGFVKRARQVESSPKPRIVSLNIVPVASPAPIVAGAHVSLSSSRPSEVALSCSTLQPQHPDTRHVRVRLWDRRQAVRSFLQLDLRGLHATSRISVSGKVAAYFPARDAVYDYVGLGRKKAGVLRRKDGESLGLVRASSREGELGYVDNLGVSNPYVYVFD